MHDATEPLITALINIEQIPSIKYPASTEIQTVIKRTSLASHC